MNTQICYIVQKSNVFSVEPSSGFFLGIDAGSGASDTPRKNVLNIPEMFLLACFEEYQHYPYYLIILTHLRAGVVELSRLADGQSSRTQDEDLPGSEYLFVLRGTRVGEAVH